MRLTRHLSAAAAAMTLLLIALLPPATAGAGVTDVRAVDETGAIITYTGGDCGTLTIEAPLEAVRVFDACIDLDLPAALCGSLSFDFTIRGEEVVLNGSFLGVALVEKPICIGSPTSITGAVDLDGHYVDDMEDPVPVRAWGEMDAVGG